MLIDEVGDVTLSGKTEFVETLTQKSTSKFTGKASFTKSISVSGDFTVNQKDVSMSFCPVGAILPFAGPDANVPEGYLLCQGQQLEIAKFKILSDVLKDAWGKSDPEHFYLPDLRGFFMRGISGESNTDPDKNDRAKNSRGGNYGNRIGSLQGDDGESHTHPIYCSKTTETDAVYAGLNNFGFNLTTDYENYDSQRLSTGPTPKSDDPKNRGTPWNVQWENGFMRPGGNPYEWAMEYRPKNVYINYIIKY